MQKILIIGCVGLGLASLVSMEAPDVVLADLDDVKQELSIDNGLLTIPEFADLVFSDAVLIDNSVEVMKGYDSETSSFVNTHSLRDLREHPRIRDDLVYT